jgi:hypothetical protein
MRTSMRGLGDGSARISESHLRLLARVPERVERKSNPKPLALARRVFVLAVLGIAVFVGLSILLTGVRP